MDSIFVSFSQQGPWRTSTSCRRRCRGRGAQASEGFAGTLEHAGVQLGANFLTQMGMCQNRGAPQVRMVFLKRHPTSAHPNLGGFWGSAVSECPRLVGFREARFLNAENCRFGHKKPIVCNQLHWRSHPVGTVSLIWANLIAATEEALLCVRTSQTMPGACLR